MKDFVSHVSDTSHWIAAFRAAESERPDAVFNDRLATKLAGERGFSMMADTPHREAMAFAMTVRTSAIDRLIYSAISKGVDHVINLGAGLDTRPYRMNVPPQLKWTEVDFPDLIAYKTEKLSDEKPQCQLHRIGVDLSHRQERQALLGRLGAESRKALVITEGVIAYLSNEAAGELAADLFSVVTFCYWIQDYRLGKMSQHGQALDLAKKMKHAPFLFDVENPVEFFEAIGWHVAENSFILDEADRIKRRLPLSFPLRVMKLFFPQRFRKLGNKMYGFVMFTKFLSK